MEEKVVNKKNKKTLLIIGILCFIAIISIVGYTYSYLQITVSNSTAITGTAASASLSLEVNKLAPDIDKPLVPQLDSAIASAVVGTQGNCVDDNGNTVCQVYEVKVKNTSNISIKIDGLLRLNVGSNPNLKWTLIDSYEDGMTENPNVIGETNKHQITTITANETYNSQQEKRYYLVVWISETTFAQADTGTFTGTITFKDSVPTSSSSNTLYALGIAPNAETPSFAKTACSSGCGENTVGVYAMEDDLGTSYYFRGDVEDNYVSFANKFWRIIRINGDGTVRMIYDGTTVHANGESSTDRRVTKSKFNSNYDDNTYVGYMYGTPGVTASGEEGYNQTHSNQHDSTIKTYLEDTWYSTLSATDKTKIADAIYCNDRSLDTSDASYTGIGTTNTSYAPYQRINGRTGPKLTCENSNDRFTLESTNFSIETNGKLDAPVGLMTIDDVILAGADGRITNKKYYLYIGDNYWTMSPTYFEFDEIYYDYYAFVFDIVSVGGFYGQYVDFNNGVRPVITINSTAITSGKGTIEKPFVVES